MAFSRSYLSKNLLLNIDVAPVYPAHDAQAIIEVMGTFLGCGNQVKLVLGNDTPDSSHYDDRLILEIVRARRWFDRMASGKIASIAELAKHEGCSAPYVSRKISLEFLAPNIVQQFLDGTLPIALTLECIKKACPLPINWDEQSAILLGR